RDFHVTGVQTCALPISGFPFIINSSALTVDQSSDNALSFTKQQQSLTRTRFIANNPPTHTNFDHRITHSHNIASPSPSHRIYDTSEERRLRNRDRHREH